VAALAASFGACLRRRGTADFGELGWGISGFSLSLQLSTAPFLSLSSPSFTFLSLPLFAFEIKFIFYGRIREATRHPTAEARPGRILRLEFIDVGLLGLSPFDSTGFGIVQLRRRVDPNAAPAADAWGHRR
jgi:hypothetical protein